MARLPDSLPQDSVDGAGLPVSAPRPTDFGLGQAAAIASQVAVQDRRASDLEQRVRDKADLDAVRPDVLALRNANVDQLANDAAQWNGTPGFAADQVKAATARAAAAAANPAYTPGQRAAFRRVSDQETLRAGDAAIAHEGALIQQRAAQAQEVQLNGARTAFLQDFAPAKQQILDAFDGSQPTFAKDVLATFDEKAAAAVAAQPEALQPAAKALFSQMRLQEGAEALAVQGHAHDAYVLGSANAQAHSLIDIVVSNPAAYDSVVRNALPGIVATIPAEHRQEAGQVLAGEAATARVKGLIQGDQPGQAIAELNDGRYDHALKPEQKEALLAQAAAANRASAPEAISQALAGQTLEGRMQADLYARLSTGKGTGLSLDEVSGAVAQRLISPEAAAKWISAGKAADQAFAQVGPVRSMTTGQLAGAAAAPQPDPADPQYADKLQLWQASTSAAQAELKARQEPGAWAWTTGVKVTGKGAAGAEAARDRGAQLQAMWGQVSAGQGGGETYAAQMLGSQKAAGIAPSAYQIVPQAEAARLAASVVNAAPDQKLPALQALAQVVAALPPTTTLADGSTVSPRALLARQLGAAHLTPVELSAVLDYGTDQAKLGRVVAALNDPTLKKAVTPAQSRTVAAAVHAQLAPYLSSVAPLPGEEGLAQARIDRTQMVAESLMVGQHMSPQDAARAAAADMTGAYRFVDGWRMPQALASHTTVDLSGLHGGADLARAGAARMLAGLLQDKGAALYAPAAGGANGDQQRALYAAAVQHNARWTTLPDDSGLTLMVPHPDGSWDQVADRYGRPVKASWSDLQALAQGRAHPFYGTPPAGQPTVGGKPVPAASKSAAFQALSWAVTGQESHFRDGQTSIKGALGRMQVTEQTVQDYAPRVGLPVDLARARDDAAYNQRIGEAALSDHINHFGATGAGLGLALAAYNAGRGRLEGTTDANGVHHPGWLQTIGDPRSGRISLDDFVARIPAKETRDYLRAVLPAALGRLQGRG